MNVVILIMALSPVPVALLVCLVVQPREVNFEIKHAELSNISSNKLFSPKMLIEVCISVLQTLKIYFVLKSIN